MQIGSGKQGVRIGEYGPSSDSNAVLGWVEPNGKNPQWIMWFLANGDAVIYTKREPGGAVIGEPIRLKARKR